MSKPILLFDLDGICCDLITKWLDHYNRDWDDHLTPEDISSWNWDRLVKPACGKRVYHYLNRPGFFADLKPIRGCAESLARLAGLCELVVVTASPREACTDKVRWVHKHLPMVPRGNMIITHRKDLVRGDFMFDDAPRNLRHHPATRIMLDYPYNREFQECHRVHSWREAEDLIRRMILDRPRRAELSAGEVTHPCPAGMQPCH